MSSIPSRPLMRSTTPPPTPTPAGPIARGAASGAPAVPTSGPGAASPPNPSTANVDLSEGARAGQTPLDNPSQLDFPDRATQAQLQESLHALTQEISAVKQQLKEVGADSEQGMTLQQGLIDRIHQLKISGAFTQHLNAISTSGVGGWTDAHALSLYPAIADTANQLHRRFGGQITFFALTEMANSIAGSETKQHGPEAGRRAAEQFLTEVTEAARGGRETLQPVISRWAEQTGFEFNPSLRGEARFDPFVDPLRAAAQQRRQDRTGSPRGTDSADAEQFRARHTADLQRITNNLDEQIYGRSAVTIDSLSNIFGRLEKMHGAEYATEALRTLEEVSGQGDRDAVRDVVRYMAQDAGYEFNQGFADNDPRRFDPFLRDRADAYRDEGGRETLLEMNRSEIGIGFSTRSGIIVRLDLDRESIRAPRWLLRQMEMVKDDPAQLRALLERSESVLTQYNGRPVRLFPRPPETPGTPTPQPAAPPTVPPASETPASVPSN